MSLREKYPYSEFLWSVFPRIRTRRVLKTSTFHVVSIVPIALNHYIFLDHIRRIVHRNNIYATVIQNLSKMGNEASKYGKITNQSPNSASKNRKLYSREQKEHVQKKGTETSDGLIKKESDELINKNGYQGSKYGATGGFME